MTFEAIVQYYTDLHSHYLKIWGAARHLGIHYGYYDQKHRTHQSAVVNMNRILAGTAGVTADDRVLDAGCGIGGTSIWLAKHCGAHVTGISITPRQITLAQKLAKRHRVDHLADFRVGNYLTTPFTDESFDVMFGLESICYAENKVDFIREAYRLLKPGGRLVVADGWLQTAKLNEQENTDMHGWLDAWAVPHLSTVENFSDNLKTIGFRNIAYRDISAQIMPSSQYMFNLYRFFSPLGFLLGRLHLWSSAQINNMVGTYWQHITLQQRLWSYGVFTAEK